MRDPRWEFRRGDGPVLATAVHSGHEVRRELAPRLALAPAERRREEDPLTDVLAGVGDDSLRCWVSRFEVDLNRPPDEAVYLRPSDAWGLQVWREPPPEAEVERSLAFRAMFYDLMAARIEELIRRHGRVLLLDIHSYNHRRGGPDAPPADPGANPDIDLGLTTADKGRFGEVIGLLAEGLAEAPLNGGRPDVRENVRFPDGGHWPEWVHATYGDRVCTVTLEYKKVFMDEWSGAANLGALEELRRGARGGSRGAAHSARRTGSPPCRPRARRRAGRHFAPPGAAGRRR